MSAMLRPVRIGPLAAAIVGFDGKAEVAAVFERCFYLAAPRGLICIGVDALGDGPINILLDAGGRAPDWSALGITPEAEGAVASNRVLVGDRFTLSLDGVPRWRPPPWPLLSSAAVQRGIDAVRGLAPSLLPAEGLSRLVIGDPRRADRTARAAAGLVQDLRAALAVSIADGAASTALGRAATLLLGLGPGLTPSGDDLLGGVFLALSGLGSVAVRDTLWHTLQAELEHLTVDISAAHLAAAAEGLASAAIHDALIAMLGADLDALPRRLQALAGVGHSSGFDTLAGLVLAAEAALAVGAPHRRRA